MKRCVWLALFLLLIIHPVHAEEAGSVCLMVVSDLHYLSPALYEDSELLINTLKRGDGKVAMYSAELLQGLLEEVKHQQPDLLILSGDLTFNGEKQSHEELAAAMRGLTKEGIPVMVIPGNHDINSRGAVQYLKDGYVFVDDVTSDDFRTIWQGMLADDMTGQGISGVYRLKDQLWIAMSDYSIYEYGVASYGMATKQHIEWLQRVAAAAKEHNAKLISVSHQALIPHVAFSAQAYSVIYGTDAVAVLADAGCKLNLSGHMHLQHILRDERITDIATGAWCMSPHRYGIVTVSQEGVLTYDACSLCAAHAADGLLEQTRSFFRQVTIEKRREVLEGLELSEAEMNEMLSFAADVNEAYFAGTVKEQPQLWDHPGLPLWLNEGAATGFGAYLASILQEPVDDACHWSSAE